MGVGWLLNNHILNSFIFCLTIYFLLCITTGIESIVVPIQIKFGMNTLGRQDIVVND